MKYEILIIVNGLIGVIGTAYAVLSILMMKPKDLLIVGTWNMFDNLDEEKLIQREQASQGLLLVFLSWVFESIAMLVNNESIRVFIIVVMCEIVIICISSIALKKINNRFRDEYKKLKEERK